MAPALALKFVFLGIRQISKPLMKATVTRARQRNTVIRAVCITLGRFTLGISCVVAKWSAEEKKPVAQWSEAQATHAAAGDGGGAEAEGLLVAPRSRSLLQAATGTNAGGPTQLVGKLFFYRRPVKSAWQAFRSGYSSSTAEEELVSTGAEVFTELLIYSFLALILFFELSYASKASEKKERNLLQRIDALEQKVNELVKEHHGVSVELLNVPEPVVMGHFGWLKEGVNTACTWFSEKLHGKE